MWGFYLKELIPGIPFFLKGLWMTVAVSGLGLIGGTIIGFLLGVVRAGNRKLMRKVIGVWVDLIRGTPFLVQIFIVFFILPELGISLQAFPAAVLALGNEAACFICEIVAGGILAVPFGQREAAAASGLSAFQQLRHVILPQAMRTILPPLVVSVIGVVDVTRVGWLTVQRIPQGILVFGLVGILYFVVCYPLIQLAAQLEKQITVVKTRL
jgi:polar amino acid transport system permease protein